MNYILFDETSVRQQMMPLSLTRPIAEMRFGILTLREKWEYHLGTKTSTLTDSYLQDKFPIIQEEDNVLINASFCPTAELVDQINALDKDGILAQNDRVIAIRMDREAMTDLEREFDLESAIECRLELLSVEHHHDLFSKLKAGIQLDFERLTKGRTSQKISESNRVIAPENIFIEEGARVEMAMINASSGPVYIGKDAEVMEGSIIRGPFVLCDHSVLKMGAKIYGPTVIGPQSKVGGEVNNSMIFGYTNKAHDGFLGNSVLGEWCNLGADTNVSNLKNTYDIVRLWSMAEETFVNTGLQFCGLIMGDHSKAGINTMFNTGTIVGVNSNIFGSNFPRNYIPSFSWGGASGFKPYNLKKAFQVAEVVMQRRNVELSNEDKAILTHIFKRGL